MDGSDSRIRGAVREDPSGPVSWASKYKKDRTPVHILEEGRQSLVDGGYPIEPKAQSVEMAGPKSRSCLFFERDKGYVHEV